MKNRFEFVIGCGLISLAISLLVHNPESGLLQLVICSITIIFTCLALVDWCIERKVVGAFLRRYLIGPPDETDQAGGENKAK